MLLVYDSPKLKKKSTELVYRMNVIEMSVHTEIHQFIKKKLKKDILRTLCSDEKLKRRERASIIFF